MEEGDNAVFGVMVESFIVEGNQKVVDVNKLTYGQSITDACINLTTSVTLLDELSAAVQAKRST
jgi:3-deoxy-7-phosphoheptulonate synthase